ncbi:uncharacterized protein BCR38DRAFT_432825 [Pseudomassariella vexata]|uniref:Heterokaryon incompatibility domain-containing protein n=1 Tax=Pseudomassariella vexata TaxID=1141098 RepID=A0A1Y2E1R5_9PEZI|nr:uncharacterized protein BCR38DRAFT_432825 [Pseudomassariella vexata]ORY65449.1 hypothetical protein BCR38DRAFT_432825 [Pseudomassariella vexata]
MPDFISDDDISPYAILSHTWGNDEATRQMWQSIPSSELQLRQGYLKIEHCRKQAVRDGVEWAYSDTYVIEDIGVTASCRLILHGQD